MGEHSGEEKKTTKNRSFTISVNPGTAVLLNSREQKLKWEEC